MKENIPSLPRLLVKSQVWQQEVGARRQEQEECSEAFSAVWLLSAAPAASASARSLTFLTHLTMNFQLPVIGFTIKPSSAGVSS